MKIRGFLKRFRSGEDGNVTVEFVILFPVLFFMLMLAFEIGFWNVHELMLRRATNLVARDVRLSTAAPPSYEDIRQAICARSLYKSGCAEDIRIEMRALPLDRWDQVTDEAPCVDRQEEFDPLSNFSPGQQNELMLMRVCRLFEPLFPGAGLGHRLSENSEGEYGIRVVTGFVTEPLS